MSDLSIPGVNSKYGTQTMIANLVKVEKTKLTAMENQKKDYQEDKTIWQSVNKKMTNVRDSAKALFGFANPFNAKTGTSTEPEALTATATRNAINGDYKFKVITQATADRFLSGNQPLDTQIPAGKYSIKVGEKEVVIDFKGGKMTNLAEALNNKGGTLIKASVIRVTSDAQVIQLESRMVGAKNKLVFNDELTAVLKKLDMLGTGQAAGRTLLEAPATLQPGEKKNLTLDPALKVTPAMVLQAEINVQPLSPEEIKAGPAPTGFRFPEAGSASFEDLTIFNSPLKGDIPKPDAPPPPTEIKDNKVFSASDGTKALALPPISEATGPQKISLNLGGVLDNVTAVGLANNNSARKIEITSLKLTDPTQSGNLKPLHPVSQAGDAIVEVDGVRVTRDKNEVDDILPGVTLNLLGPSKGELKLTIAPDKEAIKNGIINFAVNYNRLLTDISVLTAHPNNSSILEDGRFETDEEKKAAEKVLGKFQGDITLNQLKATLQRAIMNPYPTGDPEGLSILAQIGISTNAQGTGEKPNAAKLRGFLELDEKKLDSMIAKGKTDYMKNLFGMDTTGDLVVNSGAGYSVDEILRPFTQLAGINSGKMAALDAQIKKKDKEISDFNDHLARYEADLKKKYGAMESSLGALQKNFDTINGLKNTGGQ